MITRQTLANAIRLLSLDMVQQAQSGHPGMPMGMADIAQVLWGDFMRHNPGNPKWLNRDRFVLSNGHGSALLYALLHVTGYDVTLDHLRNFRQLGSCTPGHPEFGITPGVEMTAGPLGQGLAGAVGMALAEALLSSEFNRDEFKIIDHRTYCFVGDGCLMEGISHEVCSLAGTLGLGKLIVFWDDNGISIDGEVDNWWRDDTPGRFEAYGWNVIRAVDGHSFAEITAAIAVACATIDKPTLICCKTKIGYGAPNLAGSAVVHGSPLSQDEVAATRAALGWEHQPFDVPIAVYAEWDARARGQVLEAEWNKLYMEYAQAFPELARELRRRLDNSLPLAMHRLWSELLQKAQTSMQTVATRKASQQVLEVLGEHIPELLGGSADLSCSNLTMHRHVKEILPGHLAGNYINYGVREFGMAGIMNGLAVHGGFIPYGGTFLTFADYARNAIRMSALMAQRVIYVLTHDSIGLGEDGPTHQPIEHLAMLRATPKLSVWRPCDVVETVVAWQAALERVNGPTCLALTRQAVVAQPRSVEMVNEIRRGGYVLLECVDAVKAIIVATGSEVELAMRAAHVLATEGIQVRVVSMPSVDVFLQQSSEYRDSVLLPQVRARVAVEAGARAGWFQFVGLDGEVVGLDCYGESAPYKDIYAFLGLTEDVVVKAVKSSIAKCAVVLNCMD